MEVFPMECIWRKLENSHENGADEKREKKPKCHIKKYNTRIKMRKKIFLLKLSTQPKDYTKVHAKVIHP
jgi:hypothetical protein